MSDTMRDQLSTAGVRPRLRPALRALAVLLLLAPLAFAEARSPAPSPGPQEDAARHAVARHDDTVPRGAVLAYLDACREGNYERAASFLDMPAGEGADAATRARQLKVVLDQKLWVDPGSLSDQPDGRPNDGFPSGLEWIGTIESNRGDIDILLQRVTDGTKQVWKFSPSTLDAVPALYDEYGYGPLGAYLPDELFVLHFLEIQLWQWLGLALLVLVAFGAAYLVTRAASGIMKSVVSRTDTTLDDLLLDAGLRPLYLVVSVILFHAGSAPLRLSLPVRETMVGLERALVLVAAIWFAAKLIDVFAARARDQFEAQDRRAAVALVPMGRKAAKLALALLGFLALLQNLGFNVTGLIAGLGVGGIAVALAAQKSLENFFGGLMLVLDQPVRVGDFCKWGDKVGTVEEVGLRSTRVRTLARTVVAIPNSEFSNVQLENFAHRDRMLLQLVLQLRYETTAEQLRYVLAELRKLLLAHPRVTEEPARVRFVAFGAYSLDLEVFAYVNTADWNEFLGIREDIFLRMMDAVDASGTGFAFPSQTLYLGRDHGLDRKVTEASERAVREWREAGKLPFPTFSAETIAGDRDTLDYPPRGSESAPPSAD